MNLKNYLILVFVCVVFVFNGQIIFLEDFLGGSIFVGWINVDLISVVGEEVFFVYIIDLDVVVFVVLGNGLIFFFGVFGVFDGYLWVNFDCGLVLVFVILYIIELIIIVIDCFVVVDVFFFMEVFIGVFQLDVFDNVILCVSINGGIDWIVFILFFNLIIVECWLENFFLFSVDIFFVVVGEVVVLLQIQWIGGWEYFMVIDDIVLIFEDLCFVNSMCVNQFVVVVLNVCILFLQVELIGFIVDIENIGFGDQINVILIIFVIDDVIGIEVFFDMLDYGDVVLDELVENVFFENEFMFVVMFVNYMVIYVLNYDNFVDDVEFVNIICSFLIIIIDFVFLKLIDVICSVVFVVDNLFFYGNIYYVNNVIDFVLGELLLGKFIIFGMSNLDDIVGQFLIVFLYEWDGDINDDFLVNQDEYQLVGFVFYMVEGGEGNVLIIVLLELLIGDVIMFQEDKYYIVVVQYVDEINIIFFLLVFEEFDYVVMNFYIDLLMCQCFVGVLDVSNEGEFFMIGFGLDIVFVVCLNIGIEIIIDVIEL